MQVPKVEMDIFQTMLARRSVRHFASRGVERDTILTLLEAAVWAPSATHLEPWAFTVIQDRMVLKRLSDIAKPLFAEELRLSSPQMAAQISQDLKRPDFNIFYDAGTLIIICAKPAGAFAEADCWLAAENLMLAACAMDLGTCVIGMALSALSLPENRKICGIPEEYSAIVPIILGYPYGETVPTSRKPPLILNFISAPKNLN